MTDAGQIVILNGAPRSGKSSIAARIQETFDGPWMNLGVDVVARHVTPPRLRPGIGLRPGGERPEIEALIPAMYAAFYDSVAAHSRHGLNVVVDVGHHDAYSRRLGVLVDAAQRLRDLPVLFVGVRCPLEVVMERRRRSDPDHYATGEPGADPPAPVLAWQREVHRPGIYDLELDTAELSPAAAAERIRQRLLSPPNPSAFQRLAL